MLRGACVFITDAGAGHGGDFGLPSEFIFDVNDIGIVANMAKRVLDDYPFYLQLTQPAIDRVHREQLIFHREVNSIFRVIKNN
jgi:hypothetical protein